MPKVQVEQLYSSGTVEELMYDYASRQYEVEDEFDSQDKGASHSLSKQ